MMGDIFISVIITAYNRKEFLLNAVKSAINQTLDKKYYEIIVIKNFDDATIDEFIANNNIKSIFMDGTVGEFLYTGIKECKGEIISFLDDDDLFFNNKLEYVYNLFKKNNDLVYYHNNNFYMDSSANKLKKIHSNNIDFNLSCISIRSFIIDENILKKVWTAPDTLMYLFGLTSNKRLINSNIKLNFYRIHNENTSNNLKWYKEYKKQLNNFYLIFNNPKERNFLKDHILASTITIDLDEHKIIPLRNFIYYLIFLFITLNKSLFILLIKSRFQGSKNI